MTNQAQSMAGHVARANVTFASVLLFLARICLANAFMVFGTRKLLHPEQIYGFITSYHISGVPGELVYLAMPWQICFGWLIFLGLQTRTAALAMAFFCILAPSIFWLGSPEHLTRDYCVAGGFLLLFFTGPGSISLDALFKQTEGRDLLSRFFPAVMRRVASADWEDRVALFARILIASPFLIDAVKKIVRFGPERALVETAGLPGSAIYLIILVELVCGLAILVGYRSAIAAAVLIVVACISGFFLHNPNIGFLSADFTTILNRIFVVNGGNMMTFEKDLGTVGALLMVILHGPGRHAYEPGAGMSESVSKA
jgi:putative oxidoreductase